MPKMSWLLNLKICMALNDCYVHSKFYVMTLPALFSCYSIILRCLSSWLIDKSISHLVPQAAGCCYDDIGISALCSQIVMSQLLLVYRNSQVLI